MQTHMRTVSYGLVLLKRFLKHRLKRLEDGGVADGADATSAEEDSRAMAELLRNALEMLEKDKV